MALIAQEFFEVQECKSGLGNVGKVDDLLPLLMRNNLFGFQPRGHHVEPGRSSLCPRPAAVYGNLVRPSGAVGCAEIPSP